MDKISKEQWASDVELLLLGNQYGFPPGGWSDPDRVQDFWQQVNEIETRLREYRGYGQQET